MPSLPLLTLPLLTRPQQHEQRDVQPQQGSTPGRRPAPGQLPVQQAAGHSHDNEHPKQHCTGARRACLGWGGRMRLNGEQHHLVAGQLEGEGSRDMGRNRQVSSTFIVGCSQSSSMSLIVCWCRQQDRHGMLAASASVGHPAGPNVPLFCFLLQSQKQHRPPPRFPPACA